MTDTQTLIASRLRELRTANGLNQEQAGAAAEISQETYHRIETGKRPVKGAELIQLADLFNVRVSSISGLAKVRERAVGAARTDGTSPSMDTIRDYLCSYLELDAYLTRQGI